MLSHAILATNITNLTDARYFAAWEVSYLSFVIDEGHPDYISPVALAAIKDWVEGPKIIGYTEGIGDINILEKLKEYDLDGIHLGTFAPLELVGDLDEATIIKETKDLTTLDDWLSISEAIVYTGSESVIAAVKATKGLALFGNNAASLTDENKATLGLVLKGSEEEKPGYKSYDHIDDILESLEVFV